jgi:hypothetical protein
VSLFALVGRRGAYPARYTAKQARAMYAEGVRLSASDLLQVWHALPNGDLLQYDGERTRRLSDRVVNARNDARRASLTAQGFRVDDDGRASCDQCAALSINGVPTHETGCPNARHECAGCNALVPVRVKYCEDCK